MNQTIDKREMADKHSYVKRPKSVDILDRMLNHTTLTTQRITHNHILGNNSMLYGNMSLAFLKLKYK